MYTNLESLLTAKRMYKSGRHQFRRGTKGKVREVRNQLLNFRRRLKSAFEQLNALGRNPEVLINVGDEDFKRWYNNLDMLSTEIVSGDIPNKHRDGVLEYIVNEATERHLREGIAYTASDVVKAYYGLLRKLGIDELFKKLVVDETYVARFISEKRKDVVVAVIDDVVYYGVKKERDLRFVRNRLNALVDKDKITSEDMDPINTDSVEPILSKYYKELGLIRRKMGKKVCYSWKILPGKFIYYTRDIQKMTGLNHSEIIYYTHGMKVGTDYVRFSENGGKIRLLYSVSGLEKFKRKSERAKRKEEAKANFPYTTGDIGYGLDEVRKARDTLIRRGVFKEEKHYIVIEGGTNTIMYSKIGRKSLRAHLGKH